MEYNYRRIQIRKGYKSKATMKTNNLGTETIQRTARALKCIDHVERSDCLALRMLSVRHRVADNLGIELAQSRQGANKTTHILKEDLEHTTSLFVDKTRDTLHTPTTSKTPDCGLRDTCATHEPQVASRKPQTYPGCCRAESCGDA